MAKKIDFTDKIKVLTDEEIFSFPRSKEHFNKLLKDKGFSSKERRTLFGLGAHLRDEAIKFSNNMDNENKPNIDKSISYVIHTFDGVFPDSKTRGMNFKCFWLAMYGTPNFWIASALYFMKHYEFDVSYSTSYSY